jgi:hypothetical protein
MMLKYELLTSDGVKTWTGADGVDACKRYADAHPGVTVKAWRLPRVALEIGTPA